jgi:hypothetical protein
MLICEYLVGQQWTGAVISFYVVLMFAVNLTTYNVSGVYLIRILRNHQKTGISAAGEDITGSKSASPFDIVIAKTMRSMVMLSAPSFAALIMFLILGVGNCNTKPLVVFNPQSPPWATFMTFYLQLVLGLLFTRVCWVSKTALQAEVISKGMSTPSGASVNSSEGPPSQGSPDQKRSGRTMSRAEKERAKRMSQSPKPRHSENRPSTQNSRAEPEPAAVVAVTVEEPRPEVQGLSEIKPEVQGLAIV